MDNLEENVWEKAGSRRVGSGFCVHGNKLYRWRGGTAFLLEEDPEKEMILNIFDFTTGKWYTEMTGFAHDINDIPSAITGASLVGCGENLYLFGGFGTLQADVYFNGLHQLNLQSLKWRKLSFNSTNSSPIAKYLCGMVALDHEGRSGSLLVFGGFGLGAAGFPRQEGAAYHWSTEFQAMWTNELHMYNIGEQMWNDMETSGTRPPPCAAASFTQIDKSRILLFGGRQYEKRVNEIYLLDFVKWHWSGAIVPTSHIDPWPIERSLHTAVCLKDPHHLGSTLTKQRVLILWGQDANSDPITDTWILDIDNMSWTKHDNYLPAWDGRKWHSTCAYYPTSCEVIIVTCGGFTKRETELSSWQQLHEIGVDSLYAKVGILALYELCLQYVCSNAEVEDKITLLPTHIQRQVQDYKNTSKQYESLGLHKLKY